MNQLERLIQRVGGDSIQAFGLDKSISVHTRTGKIGRVIEKDSRAGKAKVKINSDGVEIFKGRDVRDLDHTFH